MQQPSSGGKWKYGIVTEIDPDKMMVRCQLPDADGIITPWLLLIVPNTLKNKDYYLPDIGEQLVILLDENSEMGCAIGAVYSTKDTPAISNLNKRRVDFDDGTSIEYDRATHVLEIKVEGDITIEATGTITLKAPRLDLNPQALELHIQRVDRKPHDHQLDRKINYVEVPKDR